MSPATFKCRHCQECFGTYMELVQHMGQLHGAERFTAAFGPNIQQHQSPELVLSGQNGSNLTTPGRFQCAHCYKCFGANKTLRRHVRQFHEGQELPVVPMGRRPKGGRVRKFKTANKRRSPRSEFRGLDRKILKFSSEAEFETWKLQEEDAVVARFVKRHGDKKIKGAVVRRFYCHRSGHYLPQRQERKRNLKVKGSCKIGVVCPASMFVTIHPTGQMQVAYYSKHQGHELEISHIGLRKEQREKLARKLASGMSFSDVCSPCCESNSSIPSHPITRKDLQNICREFGINTKEIVYANDSGNADEQIEAQDVGNLKLNCSIEQFLSQCDSSYSCIRSAMQQDLQLAEMASEHLDQLKTLVSLKVNESLLRLPGPPSNLGNE